VTVYRLGINTCFAVKRWPQPERWAALVRDELGLDLVQHGLDLVDLETPPDKVIPAFEQDDDQALADLVESARYWRDALARHAN
jgi:hypothetical protein